MEDRCNHRIAEQFAAAFASCFGDALTQALSSQVIFSPRELPPSSTRMHEHVQFRVTAKRLDDHGDCFVEFDEPDVIELAKRLQVEESGEAKTDHAGVLQRIIANCIPEIQSRLRAECGSFTLNVEQVSDLVFGEMLSVPLVGVEPTLSQIPVTLYFDDGFHRAFSSSGVSRRPAPFPLDIRNLGLVMDVELNVSLRFGQRQMPLSDVLELESGSVIELDRKVDDPIELLLDGKVIARGEAVIVDGNYGLRVTEVPQPITSHLHT